MAALPAAAHFGIIGILCSSLLIHVLVSASLGFLAIRRGLASRPLIYSVVASVIIVLFFSVVTLWIQAAGATFIYTLFVTLVAFFAAFFHYVAISSCRDMYPIVLNFLENTAQVNLCPNCMP